MSYTLTLATKVDRDLVAEVLRQAAAQRIRTATKAAGLVKADKAAKADVRASAVRVSMVLAEANTLHEFAEQLEVLVDVEAADPRAITIHLDDTLVPPAAVDAALTRLATMSDDGTSPEAQHIAALAGLEPHPLEDPETNATAEDYLDTDPAAVNLGGDAPDGHQ